MKRLFIVLFIQLALCGSIFASDWATSEGSCYKPGNWSIGGGLSLVYLGFFASADYGVHDAISAGIATGYNGKNKIGYRQNFFSLYARSALHLFNLKVLAEKVSIRNMLDPYAGLSLGFSGGWVSNNDSFHTKSDKSSPIRELLGVKFFPTSRFYLMAEEGGGLSVFNFGMGFKL